MPNRMMGITKIRNSWVVRLQYIDGEPTFYRSFTKESDAIDWRDWIVDNLKRLGRLRAPGERAKPQRNNKSGVLGVHYQEKSKDSIECFKAFFLDKKGRRNYTSFSVNKYGYFGALKLAEKSRELKRRATMKDF